MNQFLSPLESELIQQDGQHLEVVVLFVTHHINHLVDGIVLKPEFGRADILRHVDGRAVAAQQEFLIQAFRRQICPHGTIFFLIEESFLESFEHHRLPFQIGLRFVIDLVEIDAHLPVRLVESGIHPFVHLRPERAYFGVVSLPFAEHGMRFFHQGRFCLGFRLGLFFRHAFGQICRFQRCHLRSVMFLEGYVIIADQVIAFLPARFRRFALAVLQPG